MDLSQKKDVKFSGFDYLCLVYYIIIYTFNCAFDNMQKYTTIVFMILTFAFLCFKHKLSIFTFKKIKMSDLWIWYGLFYIYVCISMFWSSKDGIATSNMIVTLIQIVVFFVCIDLYTKSEREVLVLIKCHCYAAVFFAMVVMITSPISTYGTLEFGSFTGMQRNSTAYILMFGCLFNLLYVQISNKKLHYVLAVICCIVSLLTGSRKIIFGYLIAILLWAILQKNGKKSIGYLLFAALALVFVVAILYQIPYFQENYGTRLLAVVDDNIQDGSIEARNRAKQLAIILFKQSPIIGNGWNAVSASYQSFYDRLQSIYAHNNYLELAADFGIIGVILFYWKFVYSFIHSYKRARKNTIWLFMTIVFAAILVIDWGQVTYCYLPIMTIYAITFKIFEINKNRSDVKTNE